MNTAGSGERTTITNFTKELSKLQYSYGVLNSDMVYSLFKCHLAPPAPSGVTVDRTSGVQMTVSWIPLTLIEARSLIQFYRVSYSPGGSSRKRQSETTCFQSPCDVPGTESSVLIIGLDPASSYSVRVATVNGQNQQGNFSETQTAQGKCM